jgi:hypothetical protein
MEEQKATRVSTKTEDGYWDLRRRVINVFEKELKPSYILTGVTCSVSSSSSSSSCGSTAQFGP